MITINKLPEQEIAKPPPVVYDRGDGPLLHTYTDIWFGNIDFYILSVISSNFWVYNIFWHNSSLYIDFKFDL